MLPQWLKKELGHQEAEGPRAGDPVSGPKTPVVTDPYGPWVVGPSGVRALSRGGDGK